MVARARRRARTVLAAVAVAALTTGCSVQEAATGEAQRRAEAAVRASADQDPATLCALLAPHTVQELERQDSAPCEVAARSLDLGQPSGGGPTEVWGSSALVPMGPATVFLTDVDGRWKVLAAGCTLREDQPAECELGGG